MVFLYFLNILSQQGKIALVVLYLAIFECGIYYVYINALWLWCCVEFAIPSPAVKARSLVHQLAPAVVDVHIEGCQSSCQQLTWVEVIIHSITVW